MNPPARNASCPCGSGQRYKECHGALGVSAVTTIPAVIAQDPATLLQEGLEAHQRQDHNNARTRYEEVLTLDPNHPDAWHLLGLIDLEQGRPENALEKINKAVAVYPEHAKFFESLAKTQVELGLDKEAQANARRAIEIDAQDPGAWTALGRALEKENSAEAQAVWQKALSLDPDYVETLFCLGNFHRAKKDYPEAIQFYQQALAIAPKQVRLLNNLGLSYLEQKEYRKAEEYYREALAIQPDFFEAKANLADLYFIQSHHNEALAWYRQAVEIKNDVAQLWVNLGVCLQRMNSLTEAEACFIKAYELDPDNPKVVMNRGSICLEQFRFAEALPWLEQALVMQPDFPEAEITLLAACQQTCEWHRLDDLISRLRWRLLHAGKHWVIPHSLVALPFTPAEQLAAARQLVKNEVNPEPLEPLIIQNYPKDKIRIAYIGSDFRTHALANLLIEVIEKHDRSRFEVYGYSFGPDDQSPARARFAQAFDHFIDVQQESYEETAHRARNDRIAIAFDTGGHTRHARTHIFALRAAPIQINCLGYPGTLGADFYDYILTDRFVTPPEQQQHFSERFMYLPHCYMPGDTQRAIAPSPHRHEYGLPEHGFVFCCFNNTYKILPDMFKVWMNLLQQIADSALWLLESNSAAQQNLLNEAERCGIASHRLIFAPRVPLAEHLARHSLANLFLDTTPCNAHTTTNDALLMALPVLTCASETFASRVSGSHLKAIGLPELITTNLEDYQALALRLARDPNLLSSYQDRLRANRDTYPLFDTTAYTRALEELLIEAWQQRHAAGL